MAFSVSTKRSKTQNSPTFWLSLIAGSLVLHLVLLLVGRWYLSQAASAPAGTSQAPLDFVEIDPNAAPLRQPITPSNTQAQAELPKAAPPQESVTEATQAPNASGSSAIANLPRQTALERLQQPRTTPSPSPTPTNPVNPQTGQLPTEQPKPTRSPVPRPTTPSGSTPSPPPSTGGTNSGTAPSGSSGSSQPNAGSSGSSTTQPSDGTNSGATQPGGSSQSGGSSTTQPSDGTNSGTTQPGGSSQSGGSSGTSLSGEATFQGKIAQALERDPNERQKDGALSITVRNETIPPITLTLPSQIPAQVLDLKVFVVMDRDGRVFKTEVRDDSPSFLTNPELKEPEIRENIQATIYQLLANTDNLFEVKPEANTSPDQLFSRIAQIQLRVSQ